MRKVTYGNVGDENGDLWKRRAISGIKEAEDNLWMGMTWPAS
jgi:hypothetical protein